MKRILSIILILTMCLGFTACGEKIEPNDPAKDGVTNLADFIPGFADAECQLLAYRTMGDPETGQPLYLALTDEEDADIRETLLAIDLSEATNGERLTGVTSYPEMQLRFIAEDKQYILVMRSMKDPAADGFTVTSMNREGDILEIYESSGTTEYVLPHGALNADEVVAAMKSIWESTADPAYHGEFTDLETGESYPLFKRNTAGAKFLFDRGLAELGELETEVDADVQIVINGETYLFNSETGDFAWTAAGKTVCSNINEGTGRMNHEILSRQYNGQAG